MGLTVRGTLITNATESSKHGFAGCCLFVLQLYTFLRLSAKCTFTDDPQPIHFLANSIIGLSFYIQPPHSIVYSSNFNNGSSLEDISTQIDLPDRFDANPIDSGCWTAFRAGSFLLAVKFEQIGLSETETYASVVVTYLPDCAAFLNNTSSSVALSETAYQMELLPQRILTDNGTCIPENDTDASCSLSWEQSADVPLAYFTSNGSCALGFDMTCILQDPQPRNCRVNVRMQAAFILGGCLLAKAIYMVTINIRARYQGKTQVLTFGDVVVASVLDPNLKVFNECLLNSGDGYRLQVKHTCHKHCKNGQIPSIHGDEIGHCQKCRNWNHINKAADLPHPCIAIKYKKSLLSNLGSTAVTQMLILTLTSLAMLATSIFLVCGMVGIAEQYHAECDTENRISADYNCNETLAWNQNQKFGSWGGDSGSATFKSLHADSLGSEFLAMAISNGCQVFYSLLYLLLVYNMTLISMENGENGENGKRNGKGPERLWFRVTCLNRATGYSYRSKSWGH